MKEDIHKRIRKTLVKDHACYVLITCGHPSDEGNMQIEMSYEGDATLASYLLESAQMYMEEQIPEEGALNSHILSG